MVSVCMATYNGEKYLKPQIDSILAQLGKEDELIISDDGSKDKTLEIINSYNDNRIKLFHHQHSDVLKKIKYSKSFYYASTNFENALINAQGDYIFLSDQDDVWKSGRVARIAPLLDSYDCVICDNEMIDRDGKLLTSFGHKEPFSSSVFINLKNTPFLGCCMAFNKKSMSYILPLPKKCIGHDLWMGCLCAHYKSIFYLPEVYHQYRFHEGNVSPSVTKNSKNPWWFKIYYRIGFLINYFKRLFKLNS